MNKNGILSRKEAGAIFDQLPFLSRVRAYQHDSLLRQQAEAATKEPAVSDAAEIARWIREEFLAGREGTVRGDFGLKIAAAIESGSFRK